MMRVTFLLAGATLSFAHALTAQESAVVGRCYAFDQPYFAATGVFEGGPVLTWRTNVLRFRVDSGASDTLRHASQLSPLEPISFRPDTIVDRDYLEHSGWIVGQRNNVIIQWYRAPSLRMVVRGDSLLGELAVPSSDPHARRLPPQRVSAQRIDCANVPTMLMTHSDSVVVNRVAGCYELAPGAWQTDSDLIKIVPIPQGPIRFELKRSQSLKWLRLADYDHHVYYTAHSDSVVWWTEWARESETSPNIVVFTPDMMSGLRLMLSSEGTDLHGVLEAGTDAVPLDGKASATHAVVARRVACR